MFENQARLDALGLLCPLPVIRTQDAIRRLAPDTVLEVLATDPGAIPDIAAWCRVHGHRFLDSRQCAAAGCAAASQAHFHIRVQVVG